MHDICLEEGTLDDTFLPVEPTFHKLPTRGLTNFINVRSVIIERVY